MSIYLLIKTDQPQAEIYLYKDHDKAQEENWLADRRLAETIHLKIKSVLTREGLRDFNLTGIGIFQGPGSFTGLRIGHSVANALAYGLNLPIVGTSGENWVKDALRRLTSGENDKLVVPEYGAQARVTKPRK